MKINTTNEGVRYIVPSEGKHLTDGNGNYSDLVYLAANANADDWYEVDEIPEDEPIEEDDEATEADYINALRDLGVNTDEEENA